MRLTIVTYGVVIGFFLLIGFIIAAAVSAPEIVTVKPGDCVAPFIGAPRGILKEIRLRLVQRPWVLKPQYEIEEWAVVKVLPNSDIYWWHKASELKRIADSEVCYERR